MRLPGRRPARELMNTRAPPGGSSGNERRAMRKCERRLTARTVSQTSGLVPLQAHAAGDADVEHHAVQAAEGLGGLVDQPIAVGGLADVGDDPDRAAAL